MSRQKTIADKAVHAIISSQIALNMNEDLRYSIPKIYKQNLKHLTNKYLQTLIKNEKEFDLLFDNEEQSLNQVYDVMEDFVGTISKIPIWEMENLKSVIEAYTEHKDKFENFLNGLSNGLEESKQNSKDV